MVGTGIRGYLCRLKAHSLLRRGVRDNFCAGVGDFPASSELFEYNSSVYALLGIPLVMTDKYLDKINSPADLKKLPVAELEGLAEEIRQFILNSVSQTGGHLASNLGAVELTLALHYVFDFQRDKLLWDVGHQCYTHKIITGRKAGFERLRHAGGISGFPNPAESDYDQFTVGHAGTSIATAIGMALGEQLKAAASAAPRRTPAGTQPAARAADAPARPRIVAVVGDASIVNGVSFEALNNLGLVKRQMLIVLNDNSMAIDATVGAVAKYFSKVRLSQTYEDLRSHDQEHPRTPARHRPQRRGGPREDQKGHPHGPAAEPVVREPQHSVLRPGGRPRHRVPDQAVQGRWARSTTRSCCTSTRRRARASTPPTRARPGSTRPAPSRSTATTPSNRSAADQPPSYHRGLRRVADRPGRAG